MTDMPRANVWRVYLKLFNDDGTYSTTWTEITRDVVFDQLGSISESLDNTDFDVGIFRHADFNLTVRNDDGDYSDVDNPQSVFRFRRAGTQVKVTWEVETDAGPLVEIVDIDDMYVSEEVEAFHGILNDNGSKQDLESSQISFSVLGRETVLENDSVPFSSLTNGMLFSVALYTILNRSIFTALVGVSQVNIVCGTDQTIDDVTSFDGQTLLEGIQDLLAASNSVLRIVNDIAYVSARTPSATVQATFYGQASSLGAENIKSVKNIRTGIAKVFNYLLWSSTATVVSDSTSLGRNGVRKKEISYDFTTNTTKRQAILQSYVTEFKDPKQEFDIYVPVSYRNILLELLDKVSIDYPTVHLPWDQTIPICGISVCGSWWTPPTLWNFQIDPSDYYKVLSRSLDTKNGLLRLGLRLI